MGNALVRNAISEGEEPANDQGTDNQCSSPDPCAKSPNREGFLLQRTEDRRRFRKDLADLSRPESHIRWQSEADTGLESWAETQMVIASVLGPSAAQSMVRQTVLSELRAGFPHDNVTAVADPKDMSAAESTFVHKCRSGHSKA